MDFLSYYIHALHAVAWGPPMLLAMLGIGLYLMFRLSWLPPRKIIYGLKLMWKGRKPSGDAEGDIPPFSALMTALAATIGTGNIVGVPVAVSLGGPGALFWMWILALIGMATKYAEAVCAVHYRERDEDGNGIGGPMYYIKNGIGENWKWLGFLFALFGAVAAFGIGNMVQSNSIAGSFNNIGVHPLLVAVVLAGVVGFVIFGGITRIAAWATALVPFMALAYFVLALIVILAHITDVPAAFALIVKSAFTGHAAVGGFVGATILEAVRFGVARGVFSNEAGLGSAAIAHAAAKTNNPVQQGHIAMLGTFIDTIIVCSLTGLAIVLTGTWTTDVPGVEMTINAFETVLPGARYFITFALIIFGFTTILGWGYYGEKCWQYILGLKKVMIYRVLWVAFVFLAPLQLLLAQGGTKDAVNLLWTFSDLLTALMAVPNLIALVILAPVVVKLTRSYYEEKKKEEERAI